jgi:hypothetical protein
MKSVVAKKKMQTRHKASAKAPRRDNVRSNDGV